MRCEKVRETLEEVGAGEIPVPVREHLARCAACEAYARDWRFVRAGFHALAEELPPEASLGFAARLVRRLEEEAEQTGIGTEFFERVGRRFVYATLVLALTLLLALALPPSGPLRGPAAAESVLAQPEIATMRNDPIFGDEFVDNSDAAPVNQTSGVEKGQK